MYSVKSMEEVNTHPFSLLGSSSEVELPFKYAEPFRCIAKSRILDNGNRIGKRSETKTTNFLSIFFLT